MAYKQPKVPDLREGANLYQHALDVIRFLKDFCMAAWTADRRKDEDIAEIKKRLDALEGKE